MKKRFPLSRLCWITYKGPSSTLSTSDPVYTAYIADGVSPQLLSEGTPQAIGQYFGLVWTRGSATDGQGGYWTYNSASYAHAETTPLGIRLSLLNEVAGDNREPDFFELLQAAICCGSLGGSNANTSAGSTSPVACEWQMKKDQQVGVHALQIGANIIDEASPDSFPTHIVFNNGTYTYSLWGNTDLPYLFNIGNAAVVNADAIPQAPGQSTDTIQQAGVGVAFAVPTVWNPYGATSSTLSSLAPASLRISISDASLALPTTPASANSVNFFSISPNPQTPSSTSTFTTNQIPWIYGICDVLTVSRRCAHRRERRGTATLNDKRVPLAQADPALARSRIAQPDHRLPGQQSSGPRQCVCHGGSGRQLDLEPRSARAIHQYKISWLSLRPIPNPEG